MAIYQGLILLMSVASIQSDTAFPGPEVIKKVSCSTQQNMIFFC